jgi:hypothetical protein
MHAAEPVRVELSGPDGMRFLHGQPRQEIGHLAGRLGRPQAYSRFYDWPPSNQCARWTVQVAPGQAIQLHVRAGCPRAGTVRATISVDARGNATVDPPTADQGRAAT